MKRPIIIDTDPGIDDAIAIALGAFSKELDIRLITTVNGNVTIDKVTKNVLKLLTFLKRDIPVAKGASKPLLADLFDAREVHGDSGMEGFNFPKENMDLLLKESAINAMHETIMNSKEKITLVPIGPLTNIAILIRTYPEVLEKIDEIVMMGGAMARGNAGIYSEFNIKCDPEAAKIVMESSVPIIMCTLDVGLKVPIFKDEIERIRDTNDVGKMFYGLFNRYRSGSFDTGLRMFDSCAMAYLLESDIFTMKDACVKVETKGEFTYGATCMDFNGFFGEKPNAKVTYDIDIFKFKEWFFKSIEKCN